MSSPKQYRCENDSCPHGYNALFTEGSERALKFKRDWGYPADRPLDDILFCKCSAMLMEVVAVDPPVQQPRVIPEDYGVLLLCCDLSSSMMVRNPESRSTNYHLVVHSLATLLHDFCGVGRDRTEAGRPMHYQRLLLAVVRYAETVSVFKLPRGDSAQGEVVWFTPQMLAEAEAWPTDPEGTFNIGAIETTVRDKILNRGCVKPSATNLQQALRTVQELGQQVTDGQRGGDPTLPENFRGIGYIPTFRDRRQFWSVIYTDGAVNYPDRSGEAVRLAAQSLSEAVPAMHRITAYFGKETQPDEREAVRLLQEIASPCFGLHDTTAAAYFGPEDAKNLRKIIHMATMDKDRSGICSLCLQKLLRQ